MEWRIRRLHRLPRVDRGGNLTDVDGGEVSGSVVQPDADGLTGELGANDDVEVVVGVDVRSADRDRIVRRLEREIVGSLPRQRDLDSICVSDRTASHVIGNGDVRLAVSVEVSDDG